MRSSMTSRGFARRVLPFVLAIPVIVIPVAGYLIASDGGRAGLPVAEGAVGGTFHPIAGEFVADDTALRDCHADAPCFEQAFGNISFRDGPKSALAVFERRLATDPVILKGCHRISHFIGAAALERFDGDVAATFAKGSPACVSGYYHGILERAFLGISTKAGLVRSARSLCRADGIRRHGFLDYQCRHGLGHGLMIQTGYALPLALAICAELGTGWDRKACAGGVFMENVNTQFGFRSPWLDDEDPLYPCRLVMSADQRSCYLRASWRILASEQGSFARTAAACARLGQWARTCFHGLGRDAAERARYVPEKVRPLCRVADTAEGDCLRGAARTIANASGPAGIEPARRLCARAPLRQRANCFAGIGVVIGMLRPATSTRVLACRRVTPEHIRQCVEAAEAEIDPRGANSWG